MPLAAADYPWLKSYPPEVDWSAPLSAKPLHLLLDDAAAANPENDCVDFQDKRYSYAEIKSLSDRAAKGLVAAGFKPGMKLGLFLPNCPYFVIFYYAGLKAGGTVVNFNPLYAEPEVARQIEDSHTDFMVTLDLDVLLPKISAMLNKTRLKQIVVCPMAEQLPFPKNLMFPVFFRRSIIDTPEDGRHIAFKMLIDNDGAIQPPAIDPAAAVAVLQYTGGTTGVPKGAALSHANVYVNAIQCKRWFFTVDSPSSKVVGVLPLFHAFAMTCVMNWALAVGGTMLLEPRFDAKKLLRLIHRKRPAALAGVPTLFTALMNTPGIDDFDLSSLKFCISGGAPLPLEVRKNFEKRANAVIVEGYGLSEASPVCCINPIHSGSRPGSIGLPLPQTSCEIVSLEDKHALVKRGETGEICFRGPQVMLGYWQRKDATDEVIFDGRLHTGDVGHIDAEGFVFVTDRLKEMINASGYKVYPRLVEEAIYQHPAVKECAVFGVDDPYRGQTVKAVVSLKADATLTAKELDQFLESRLSHIEKPKQYEFRAELPKTAVGKIYKKALIDEEKAKATTPANPSVEKAL